MTRPGTLVQASTMAQHVRAVECHSVCQQWIFIDFFIQVMHRVMQHAGKMDLPAASTACPHMHLVTRTPYTVAATSSPHLRPFILCPIMHLSPSPFSRIQYSHPPYAPCHAPTPHDIKRLVKLQSKHITGTVYRARPAHEDCSIWSVLVKHTSTSFLSRRQQSEADETASFCLCGHIILVCTWGVKQVKPFLC